ncbi:MAG: type II toxin-antitoxin system VapB family antitoxin [Chloroflexi bacterium]|nr:type II toxin-antitoxin system VapB family antitoxin [Chloroflexota bacterium]
MARGKVTITLDRDKAEQAMRWSGHRTVSGVIDAALDAYIRTERNQRDAEIYERMPITADEFPTDYFGGKLDLGDDDVDYEESYGSKDLQREDPR